MLGQNYNSCQEAFRLSKLLVIYSEVTEDYPNLDHDLLRLLLHDNLGNHGYNILLVHNYLTYELI
jgi:hypothetical protein